MREMLSVSAIRRNMREDWISAVSMNSWMISWSSGWIPPSIMTSMVCRLPWMTVSGVRSSCATWPVSSSAAVLKGDCVKAMIVCLSCVFCALAE
jgi:hypothetical protein